LNTIVSDMIREKFCKWKEEIRKTFISTKLKKHLSPSLSFAKGCDRSEISYVENGSAGKSWQRKEAT